MVYSVSECYIVSYMKGIVKGVYMVTEIFEFHEGDAKLNNSLLPKVTNEINRGAQRYAVVSRYKTETH